MLPRDRDEWSVQTADQINPGRLTQPHPTRSPKFSIEAEFSMIVFQGFVKL
jgi:hypothetical protein